MSKQCPCQCRCCISDGCGASEHYPKDEYGELDGGIQIVYNLSSADNQYTEENTMRGSHISDDGRFKLLGIFVPSGSCMVATCQDDAFCEYRDNETGKNVYTCMECQPTATLPLPLTEVT